jgi:hypothetical protein
VRVLSGWFRCAAGHNRLSNGSTALAHLEKLTSKAQDWLALNELAPLLAAEAMDDQFDIGGSQRRVA